MNGKSKPYAILVFGAPMSGKTVFSEQFSEKYNAPFLNLAELREQYNVSRKACITLITQIAKCKQTLVIEGAIETEKQRMRRKYKTIADAKTALAESYKKIDAPADHEDPLVISGKHMFQTQCRNVLLGLSDRKNAPKK